MNKLVRTLIIFLFPLFSPALAQGGSERGNKDDAAARAFIQERHAQLNRALAAAKSAKRDRRVIEVFDQLLDYEYFAAQTLGKHSLEPEQKKVASCLLRRLIRTSYRNSLRTPKLYELRYAGESTGKHGITVATEAAHRTKPSEPKVEVAYDVERVGGGFKVRDISTAGISLLRNYRRQFGRIIKKKGGKALIDLMATQLSKLKGDPAGCR